MEEDLPAIQDTEYLISNIAKSLNLSDGSTLLQALRNSYVSFKEVKKGETWNDDGVLLKYIQFSFLVDIEHKGTIVDSFPSILKGSKSFLHYHGYRHVQWKPLVTVRPVKIDQHLYKNTEFISYSGCFYRSKSEVKIAKELENRNVNFIANGRGRFNCSSRCKTIEPDFIVFHNGQCAVLEVDGEGFHDDLDREKERDEALGQSGFLFVEHYSATSCYSEPEKVVESFIKKLENFT
ncbi:hypothetical protein ACEWBS_22255 [Vibrio parahaemolyticus]